MLTRLARAALIPAVLILALLLGLSVPARAVGTVTLTSTSVGGGVVKYTITWVSDASGDVSGNTAVLRNIIRGHLVQVRVVPDSGGTQPSDLYDITLVDEDGVDILAGSGADQSNATGEYFQFDPPFLYDKTYVLDIVVANAGNAKGGTVEIWVTR